MIKKIPLLYGSVAAVISFVAVFFLCLRTFKLGNTVSIVWGLVLAVVFFGIAYYRAYASEEIKRIVFKFHLTEEDLARITGMRAQDFAIYQDSLQLLLPKRYLPFVLKRLRRVERQRDYASRK